MMKNLILGCAVIALSFSGNLVFADDHGGKKVKGSAGSSSEHGGKEVAACAKDAKECRKSCKDGDKKCSKSCKHDDATCKKEHGGKKVKKGKEHGGIKVKKGTEHGGLNIKEHGGKTAEHGGKTAEHGGKTAEHGGKTAEHGGKTAEHGGLNINRQITVTDIKQALTSYITANTKKGVFTIVDKDSSNQVMKLKFKKIHDPVRHMEKKGQYFACTDFEIIGKNGKLHDVDFWMIPTSTGLEVIRTKVHKDPVWKNAKWIKVPRYTFRDENIVALKNKTKK